MYPITSLVAFLDNRRNKLDGDQIPEIMKRAESFTDTGSEEFHEGTVDLIFEDAELAAEFRREALKIPDADALLQIEFGSSSMGMM